MKAKLAAALLLLPLALPCLAQSLAIRVPAAERVEFRGAFNHDRAQQGAGNMMYPVGNAGLAGLLVGIVTHAAIVNSARESQRKEAEAAGERMLEPYRFVLDGLQHGDLMRDGLLGTKLEATSRVIGASEPDEADLQMEIAPVFWLTMDQRALVLEATMAVAKRGEAAPVWKQSMRILSPVEPGGDGEPSHRWTADNGALLRKTSAALLGVAYELALAQAKGTAPVDLPQRTVRFWEGAQQRIERATLIDENQCGRATIRNLRGELMSVPLSGGVGDKTPPTSFACPI